jgi:protein SCO1/2
MSDMPQQLPRTLWVGVFLMFCLLCVAGLLSMAEMRSEQQHSLPVISQIADFTLTNQDGQVTKLAALTNHVWVADIIFTRCAGPCPRLTAQMKSVQDRLAPDRNVRLVTLTTDPDYDSPEILKRYGQRVDADFNRWTFLTGTKEGIAGLAAGSLKLGSTPIAPADQKSPVDLFIHTTIFVLVDKHTRLRASFQTGGEGVDWENSVRPKLFADIRRLEREP